MSIIIPVILAGGAGTRLWPLSRKSYPKQFLSLVHENQTLLQSTILRIAKDTQFLPPIIVCHEEYRFIVAEQCRQIAVEPLAIILESKANNTAPAVALSALLAEKKYPNSVLWVMPADHEIDKPERLYESFFNALPAIESGYLLTFGLEAKSPETGYGYIKKMDAYLADGVFKVEKFVEKPSLSVAKEYVASGNYFWNSGIFAFKSSVYLAEYQQHDVGGYQYCKKAMDASIVDKDFIRPSAQYLAQCTVDSIDYAVMEKTVLGGVVPLASNWSDLGSWEALTELMDSDELGNISLGDVLSIDSQGNYLRSEHKLLATVGLNNTIVVVTDDAVLVADKKKSQQVKQLVEQLRQQGRTEADNQLLVYRPWGSYQVLVEGEGFKVKSIKVNPGQQLSLQLHNQRSEHWVVVKGHATVLNGEKEFLLTENQSTFIPVETRHCLTNHAENVLEIIEVQVGAYLGEDDIVRFSDQYGRTSEAKV